MYTQKVFLLLAGLPISFAGGSFHCVRTSIIGDKLLIPFNISSAVGVLFISSLLASMSSRVLPIFSSSRFTVSVLISSFSLYHNFSLAHGKQNGSSFSL